MIARQGASEDISLESALYLKSQSYENQAASLDIHKHHDDRKPHPTAMNREFFLRNTI